MTLTDRRYSNTSTTKKTQFTESKKISTNGTSTNKSSTTGTRENKTWLNIQTTILSRILKGILLKIITIKTLSIRGVVVNINHLGGRIMIMLLGRGVLGMMGRRISQMRVGTRGRVTMGMRCLKNKRDLTGTNPILAVGYNRRTLKCLRSTPTIQNCTLPSKPRSKQKHKIQELDPHPEIKITTPQKSR